MLLLLCSKLKNLCKIGDLLQLPVERLNLATCKNLWSSMELVLLLTVERLDPATCKNLWSIWS
jgi:hypothetical protein